MEKKPDTAASFIHLLSQSMQRYMTSALKSNSYAGTFLSEPNVQLAVKSTKTACHSAEIQMTLYFSTFTYQQCCFYTLNRFFI